MQRIPISDARLEENPYLPPYYHPGPTPGDPLHAGSAPHPWRFPSGSSNQDEGAAAAARDVYKALKKGSGNQEVATTMATVRTFKELLRDKAIGPRLVPIIPTRPARSAWTLGSRA